jgi:hypothetical protein
MMNFISTVFAACTDPNDPIGCVSPPPFIGTGIDASGKLVGPMVFLNTILKLVFAVGGLWAFFNIVLAGFGFMTAGGDPKQFGKAWDRIWQSLLGLFVIVMSFLLAAIIGIIFFKNPAYLFNLTL